MMKCAVGCVNKMAFLTEDDTAVELYSQCIPSGVTSLTHCLSYLLTFLPFDASEAGNNRAHCSPDISGGNWDSSLSPLISMCGEIKGGEKGSLIKRRVSNPLSGWEEMFLMKCNTLPNCADASGAQYTFQRKICMNFKCSISQLRPDTSERKGRRDQSL